MPSPQSRRHLDRGTRHRTSATKSGWKLKVSGGPGQGGSMSLPVTEVWVLGAGLVGVLRASLAHGHPSGWGASTPSRHQPPGPPGGTKQGLSLLYNLQALGHLAHASHQPRPQGCQNTPPISGARNKTTGPSKQKMYPRSGLAGGQESVSLKGQAVWSTVTTGGQAGWGQCPPHTLRGPLGSPGQRPREQVTR